ncbi:MAG: GNAT family N-acetyltransferase [bacterium]
MRDGRVIYRTARLDVRWLTRDDYDVMYACYSDADAMRFVGDGTPITPEDCARWVDVTLANYETRGYGMSALVLRETGAVVGFCGLVHPGGQVEVELKYTLLRGFWGRGLASEAAAGMVRYGMDVLGIGRIIATIDPAHDVSARVLRKVGFRWVETRACDEGPEALYVIEREGSIA